MHVSIREAHLFSDLYCKVLSKILLGEKSSTLPEIFFQYVLPEFNLQAVKQSNNVCSLIFALKFAYNHMVCVHCRHHPKQDYILVLDSFPLEKRFSLRHYLRRCCKEIVKTQFQAIQFSCRSRGSSRTQRLYQGQREGREVGSRVRDERSESWWPVRPQGRVTGGGNRH